MTMQLHTGFDIFLDEHLAAEDSARIGLIAHPASVDAEGRTSWDRLHDRIGSRLTALFGPEHGFTGTAGAGDAVADARHPEWGIPIHSLYGDVKKPSPAMLENIDVLLFDIQDLGARCYTYASTLRLVLEAAAETNKRMVVADRPIPLPNTLDGPMLEPAFESFVGMLPAPLVYGMTPAETARWLHNTLAMDVDLEVVPMQGYQRECQRRDDWPAWVPPSPAIRSWESAWCYTATVFCEALPALTCDRDTAHAFQVLRMTGLDAPALCRRMNQIDLPGVRFREADGSPAGIRLEITEPDTFLPVRTGITLLHEISSLHTDAAVWGAPETREPFFDKLLGTDTVRHALRHNGDWAAWDGPARQTFEAEREGALLYGRTGDPS